LIYVESAQILDSSLLFYFDAHSRSFVYWFSMPFIFIFSWL